MIDLFKKKKKKKWPRDLDVEEESDHPVHEEYTQEKPVKK